MQRVQNEATTLLPDAMLAVSLAAVSQQIA